MEERALASVDATLCTGCGQCVAVCPDRIFTLEQGVARARQEECLACGHCVAVCPTGAVQRPHGDTWSQDYAGFARLDDWLPPGRGDAGELVRLMRSRRSCRNFKETPVPRELLEDLVRMGITAPSGTNSQRWSFTLLPHRAAVLALAEPIKAFFLALNRTASRAWLRKGLALVGQGELEDYYRNYYAAVSEALREWDTQGVDRLFHGATAAIVVGSAPGASCPAEDALLATQNMLLGAHVLGLGSCLIGYAVAAMGRKPAIKATVGIPRNEAVYAVLALGYPRESYRRVTERRKPLLRWVE